MTMQELHNLSRRGGSLIRVAAAAAVLLVGSCGYADILSTSAAVRPNNSLLVDVQVTTGPSVEHVFITYQTAGVDPLVSRLTQVSANKPDHDHHRICCGQAGHTHPKWLPPDRDGSPAGTASGSFTTGSLPPPLLTNTYTLTGRTTAPPCRHAGDNQVGFRGWVGLDLHSSDAPQIVWYYSNVPSNASGALQADTVGSIVRQRNGNFLFGDAGTGRSHGLGHFLSNDHARRDASRRESVRLRRDAADRAACCGGLDLGPGKRLARTPSARRGRCPRHGPPPWQNLQGPVLRRRAGSAGQAVAGGKQHSPLEPRGVGQGRKRVRTPSTSSIR